MTFPWLIGICVVSVILIDNKSDQRRNRLQQRRFPRTILETLGKCTSNQKLHRYPTIPRTGASKYLFEPEQIFSIQCAEDLRLSSRSIALILITLSSIKFQEHVLVFILCTSRSREIDGRCLLRYWFDTNSCLKGTHFYISYIVIISQPPPAGGKS